MIERTMVRIIVALVVFATVPAGAAAQQSRVYAGGAIDFVTQTQSDQPLGGTKAGARALFGVAITPRASIEFEPSSGGQYSWEYTYRPAPSLIATVTPTRRDTFFPVQARFALGVLEPVVGIGIVRSAIARHAVFDNGVTYFDDSRTDTNLVFVGGLDAAFNVASHLYVVPTFRVLAMPQQTISLDDPLGEQTNTGPFAFRYGIGARVAF